MTAETAEKITCWCVEVADSERDQLVAAFAQHPELEPRLLLGPLAAHQHNLSTAEILSVFIESHVTSGVLEDLPNLKLLVTRSTGFDHIDLGACAERGVTVAHVPAYGENTVAEHTFALLLALARKLLAAERHGRVGRWDRQGLQGFDLKGKTVGVIGGGRIGLHFIRMARAFQMTVIVFDPRRDSLLADVLGFEYATLDDLFARSDVVSLHAPSNKNTYHLINAESLAKMKRGAILLNTARGDLINTRDLVSALNSGQLGGAGLDVVEGEQDVSEDLLLLGNGSEEELRAAFSRRLLSDREDVIITPHNAFNSYEAVQRIAEVSVEAMAAYVAGEPIETVVEAS